MTTRAHYESLLAEHYTWMFGVPFAQKVAEQRELLEQLGALPAGRGLALDLGAGSGFQAVALAELGFQRVVAVDLSPSLLAELSDRKEQHSIEVVEADMIDYLAGCAAGTADMIVCMGDTLTHLESKANVTRMFVLAQSVLKPGGSLVLTYRDLSAELTGADRFIQVAADEHRILTCFLEYAADAVVVHDLLHERKNGSWGLRKSAYPKLRLGQEWVAAALRNAKFTSVEPGPAGRLTGVVARKE